jgi:hypothetical protein
MSGNASQVVIPAVCQIAFSVLCITHSMSMKCLLQVLDSLRSTWPVNYIYSITVGMPRVPITLRKVRHVLTITPFAVAAFVAISRTMDYRHRILFPCCMLILICSDHSHDVLTGSALGLTLVYFSCRQYYPHLASVDAHKPYATRFEETETGTGIGGTEITDTLLGRYEGDDDEIGTRRNPKTGIRR